MNSVLQESIGFAGFVTNVLGNILVGRKNEHGWWVRLLSNGLWFAYAIQALTLSLVVNAVVFTIINIYYWRKWRREQGMNRVQATEQSWACTACGADAYWAADGCWRHRNQEPGDPSQFCDRYGYPVTVESKAPDTEREAEEDTQRFFCSSIPPADASETGIRAVLPMEEDVVEVPSEEQELRQLKALVRAWLLARELGINDEAHALTVKVFLEGQPLPGEAVDDRVERASVRGP